MKKLLCLCAAVFLAFSPVVALAATDVTGSWIGEIKGPDGSGFPITFTFKQDGAKLTGAVLGGQGDPIAISNGAVDGDKISFTVAFNGMTITHQGTFVKSPDGTPAGDAIKLTSKSEQGDFPGGEMTLKRSK